MAKKITLLFAFLFTNLLFSQDFKPATELQGKWKNVDFEIEVNQNSIVIKNKKSAKAKEVILNFLELPKVNSNNEFESWSCTEIFNASVVKQGNIEVKEDLNEYIYLRLKLKKEKLIFEFTNSLYSNNFNKSHKIVPQNVKKIYSENGFFNNKIKLER